MKKLALLAVFSGALAISCFAQSTSNLGVGVTESPYKAVSWNDASVSLNPTGTYSYNVNGVGSGNYDKATVNEGLKAYANVAYSLSLGFTGTAVGVQTWNSIFIGAPTFPTAGASANNGDPYNVHISDVGIGLSDGVGPFNNTLVVTIS